MYHINNGADFPLEHYSIALAVTMEGRVYWLLDQYYDCLSLLSSPPNDSPHLARNINLEHCTKVPIHDIMHNTVPYQGSFLPRYLYMPASSHSYQQSLCQIFCFAAI